MVVGILQFEVLIHDAESIKDKRRVVNSLKDRLHREFMVSIAEVGNPDAMDHALLAAALVARDGARVGEVLDHITEKLRELKDAELGDVSREVLHGKSVADVAAAIGSNPNPTAHAADDDADLADELLRHFHQSPQITADATTPLGSSTTKTHDDTSRRSLPHDTPTAPRGSAAFDAATPARKGGPA
jgi:uncharacterized protein